MKEFQLTSRQVKKLKAVHRSLLNKRNAYRINVIILLGTGWSYTAVAEALLLDESSAKNYLKRYLEGGLEALMNDNYQGGFTKLTPEELSELELYLEENLYQRVEDIVEYVPYSPNLNLIERLWLFYQKKILHNKYYETFLELKEATVKFFRYAAKYKEELSGLLTENFELIGA